MLNVKVLRFAGKKNSSFLIEIPRGKHSNMVFDSAEQKCFNKELQQ